MVDPNLICDLGAHLGMVLIKDGSDEAGHDKLSKKIVEIVGLKNNEITHTTTFDRENKSIATILNHDEDACDMHNCDNIRRSVTGDLIITKNKV